MFQELLNLGHTLVEYVFLFFYCIFVQFMQFPAHDFGLDHFANSQPFKSWYSSLMMALCLYISVGGFGVEHPQVPPSSSTYNMSVGYHPPRPAIPSAADLHLERDNNWIWLRPIDNTSSFLCHRHQWLSGKSAWLVFRRSWVWFSAGSRSFS